MDFVHSTWNQSLKNTWPSPIFIYLFFFLKHGPKDNLEQAHVSGGVALLHPDHNTGLMCTTVYLWCSHVLHIFGWDSLKLPILFSTDVGLINPNYNNNSRLYLNPSSSLMAYECQTTSPSIRRKPGKFIFSTEKNHTLLWIWT
jgi:hypothetical protein